MKNVAVVVQDGVEPFGLGSICEVWAEPYHPEDDNPVFEFTVCTPHPGRVQGASGFDLYVEHGLEALDDADLVCIAPKREFLHQSPEAVAAVRRAADRGAIISAHCTGAWLLGKAGLLDGRECTTHWRYGDLLQETFPRAKVKPEVLYVFDGNILTGAGSAAGIDASLHLVRRTFGARTAANTARRIVVPPHRDGGQAQFVRTPMGQTEADTLAPLLAWVSERLDESMPVERLAAEAHMSPRTFARRFRDETGTTPLQWLTGQRLALAEELLENSSLSVEQIASRVGFGNAATLRHHFTASRGTTPQAYRKTFTCLEEQSA
ncbi:MAG: GlxA family transcriptional regulator [Aeromicrobium sp.]